MLLEECFIWRLVGLIDGMMEKKYGPLIIQPNTIYFICLSEILTSSKSKTKLLFESIGRSSAIALAKRQTHAKKTANEQLDRLGEITGKLDNLLLEYENSIKINKSEITQCVSKGFSYSLFTIKTGKKSYTFHLLEANKNNINEDARPIESSRKETNTAFFQFINNNNYPFESNWWGL
jgi:hypothetical protein